MKPIFIKYFPVGHILPASRLFISYATALFIVRVIQATIPILYRSVDMNGVIVDCNQAYADRLGYTVEEIVGKSLFEHSTKDTREALRKAFVDWTVSQKTNIPIRIKLEARNGDAIDVVRTFRNRYDGDDIVGIDSSIMEFSHIKRLQDMYNVGARDGYEDPNILRRSVDYIGTVIDCNQSYLDNMGYTKDEVVGISLYEHTASRSKGNLHANMNNWRIGIHNPAKIWMKRRDGSEFPAHLTSVDETNKEGVVVGRTVSLKIMDG